MSSDDPGRTGAGRQGPRSLRRCVGDVERFLADAWGRRYHLHSEPAEQHPPLLTLDDVDTILTQTSPRTPAFRLVKDGDPLPRASYTRAGTLGGQRLSDLPDVGRVLELFREGATIALQGLHRYWPPVTALCREFEEFLTHPVQANAYITPPGARGLDVHHDTHDVFAIQTEGRKHWVVHEPALEMPLAEQRWSSKEHQPGPLALDVDLLPGDCLYLPRGTPHAAETREDVSVHLTVGVRALRWHDLLGVALERAGDERTFREALPVGFAHQPRRMAAQVATVLKDAAAWLESQQPHDLIQEVSDRFWSGRTPTLTGQLRQLLRLEDIGPDTPVQRRDGIVARVRVDQDVELLLGDRTVRLPESTAGPLRQLLSGDVLRGLDLDGDLDEGSRLVLIRRLVREGVLIAALDADE